MLLHKRLFGRLLGHMMRYLIQIVLDL